MPAVIGMPGQESLLCSSARLLSHAPTPSPAVRFGPARWLPLRSSCSPQAYLKDTPARLKVDLERARRERYVLGAKLVSGREVGGRGEWRGSDVKRARGGRGELARGERGLHRQAPQGMVGSQTHLRCAVVWRTMHAGAGRLHGD